MTQLEQKKKTNTETLNQKADPKTLASECGERVSVVLMYSRRRWSHSMTTSEIPYGVEVEANAVERHGKVNVVSFKLAFVFHA